MPCAAARPASARCVVADRYQYLVLMAACVLITLPLEFVLRARIYRRPRPYLAALLPVVVIFCVWDVVAIAREHWWYSPAYTTGVVLPAGLPLTCGWLVSARLPRAPLVCPCSMSAPRLRSSGLVRTDCRADDGRRQLGIGRHPVG